MGEVDLRLLRYFVAVAERRHFGRAAEDLHMAQSPLSQAIRALEGHLGAALFVRTTRRVDLTPAGETLLSEARRILGAVDAARDRVAEVAAGRLGHLRCGVTGLATAAEIPRLVRLAARRLPGVALSFRGDLLTPDQERALLDEEIDLGLLRPPVRSDRLVVATLRREGLVLAAPAAHRLALADRVVLADLADEDFVVYDTPGSVVDAAVTRACARAGFAPRRAHAAGQTAVVLALVAAGCGIALLPESVRALGLDGVAYVPVADAAAGPGRPADDGRADTGGGSPGPGVDLALAWRRDDPSPALARLVDVVLAEERVPA